MKNQYVQIDMEALGKILKDRGITKVAFSEALGYTYSWYHALKTRNGRATTAQLKTISMIHDIPAERILAKEPEREEENPVLYIIKTLQNIEERITKLEKAWT